MIKKCVYQFLDAGQRTWRRNSSSRSAVLVISSTMWNFIWVKLAVNHFRPLGQSVRSSAQSIKATIPSMLEVIAGVHREGEALRLETTGWRYGG